MRYELQVFSVVYKYVIVTATMTTKLNKEDFTNFPKIRILLN